MYIINKFLAQAWPEKEISEDSELTGVRNSRMQRNQRPDLNETDSDLHPSCNCECSGVKNCCRKICEEEFWRSLDPRKVNWREKLSNFCLRRDIEK